MVAFSMVVFMRLSLLHRPPTTAAADKPRRSFRNLVYSRRWRWFPVTGRTSQSQRSRHIPSVCFGLFSLVSHHSRSHNTILAPINISQWKKGKCIGSGSSGKVYLASNRSGQLCAIKEVQVISNDTRSKEHLKQLNQEIVFLEQLSHPNIVQYRGSILNGDVLSIYTEYASKGSIDNLLRKDGPFEECRIRHITTEILSGLAYLHGNNIVHRDIKGANVLITDSNEVKLADFGVAKSISSLAEVHSSDKGTVYWMAPEVIRSNFSGNGYNVAVDIWSLGCTIIEMATARHPWNQCEMTEQAMFRIAFTEDIPEIPESLSSVAKNFVLLCLQRDAVCRPSATGLMHHAFIRNQGVITSATPSTQETEAGEAGLSTVAGLTRRGNRAHVPNAHVHGTEWA